LNVFVIACPSGNWILVDNNLYLLSRNVLDADDATIECATSQGRFLARIDEPSKERAIFALLDQAWNTKGTENDY